MQEVFVVFSAAALIFLVCRAIISCCSHDRNDEDDDRGYRRVFLESASGHFVPESYARNGAESGVGQNGAEDLRSQARSLRREWEETLKLADRARKKGDYAAAARYKRDVQGHPSAVEYLNKLAAEVNFTEKNKGRTDGMVDLHGLLVEEALEYAEQAFQSATLRNDKVVRFIVGKGLHAKDGIPKIRPALESLCETRGFKHNLDPKNAGVLVVQCRRE
ncbi:hypothetical protein DFH94DRAFT_731080 [Russula ochroleuca]|jgi:DNA-nicking Smr family endonuclease|uniref:Smr domain-containing protein n=1 Tax=Russula ochroleuca TaxID=152965 RepID=A0A9P5N0H8_9AGAM|nr:hypothetical protein DFH94DRAFT_731080 [Russula ochroleuca]